MAKRTSIAEAIKKFEEKYQVSAATAEEVLLYGQLPPIDKMDGALAVLYPNCKKLSLSSNTISSISNIAGFQKLEILSLGRNLFKNINSLEPIAHTLQQLWISYNQIEKLAGLTCLKQLRVLYMSNNKVKDMVEFERLVELPCLEDLHFVGNPLEDRLSKEGKWRTEVARILPKLKRLDGKILEVTWTEPATTAPSEGAPSQPPPTV